ncbi:MAG: response regulator [Candidatus Latescibacteria bacterium]|nr:response regulator [Candidatus Latescibacterota bacterium]
MKKILVIEDVEMNRDLIVQLLEEDYAIVEAVDGLQGLALAETERPDLILTDLSLPKLDGWALVARIRAMEALRDVPIIAVTAHAMAGDDRRALKAGCNAYLTKPIDVEELYAKVQRLLGD